MSATAMTAKEAAALERVFDALTGDDSDERLCTAISESACRDQPRNFLLNAANGAATKLAEQLASPGLVLPWILAAVGAPAAFAGWLVPIRQAGALVPQMAAAAAIRALPRRKVAWSAAGAVQAVALLLMIPALLWLPPVAAGLTVLVLLAAFSVASGVGSVAFQDVMPKTVAKGLRGRLLSIRASVGGALTLFAAAGLTFGLGEGEDAYWYAALLGAAALLWAIGALLFLLIDESPGETEGGRNALDEFRHGMEWARGKPGYRRFLVARGLLSIIELSVPFYALHAHALFGGSLSDLGLFVFAVGLANVFSSPFWGRFADLSSRRVMVLSAALAAAAALAALVWDALALAEFGPWLYMSVFILIGIAQAGVRLGRKTYLADGAPADQRPMLVAFANLVAGLVMLGGGAIGIVGQIFGQAVLIALLFVVVAVAGLAAWRLPEADKMAA